MTREAAKAQFKKWAYGMFIHYGVYSVYGLGEWLLSKERMNEKEYFEAQKDFIPRPGCTRNWVETAKKCGMKYAVLTTRHHDGYFIGHQLVNEFCNSCREFGLGVGLYYSVMDWCDSDYRKGPSAPEWRRFVDKTHSQVRQLMTDFGDIDYLFYDGCPPPETWEVEKLHSEIRKLQPGLLVSRCRADIDVYSCEQHSGGMAGKLWESCYTLNDTWGYNKFDNNWKSPTKIIEMLTTIAHNNGNLLLNVGPMADGTIQSKAVDTLSTVGEWLAKNGEAVYDAQPYPFNYFDREISTAQGSTIYIRLTDEWRGRERKICGIGNRVKRISILATGEEFEFTQNNDRIVLSGLPPKQTDELPRMLKLELDGLPQGVRNPMFPDCDIRVTGD